MIVLQYDIGSVSDCLYLYSVGVGGVFVLLVLKHLGCWRGRSGVESLGLVAMMRETGLLALHDYYMNIMFRCEISI